MKKSSFAQAESLCEFTFLRLGKCWHLYTPENYPVFLTDMEDFRAAMTLLAICAVCFPSIRILTFQWMNNHLHVCLSGPEADVDSLFSMLKRYLGNYMKASGRKGILDDWDYKKRPVDSLNDLRNVIAYNNRNGFLVKDEYSPYSYPWGANRCFFNIDYAARYSVSSQVLTASKIRELFHTRELDGYKGMRMVDDVVCPLSFCDIGSAMKLFRNESHYFYCVSKNVESMRGIAAQIGESISYNDDELYAIVCNICRRQYSVDKPSLLPATAKVEVARKMRYDYNSSRKQIARILRIDPALVEQFL